MTPDTIAPPPCLNSAASPRPPGFRKLIADGQRLLTAPPAADYFAKFGEKESARAREARAHYWIALGEAGLGRTEAAISALERALRSNPAHLWAGTQFELLRAAQTTDPTTD